MKRRMGFVANSSSVGYIISRAAYPSVFALAAKLISLRDFEDDKKLAKKVRSSNRNPDTPIAFSTINCDTTVDLRGDQYFVCTDKNHYFDEAIEGADWMYEDSMQYPDNKLAFYYPEYELLGRLYLDKNGESIVCGKHFAEHLILENGSIECPRCYYERHLKYQKLTA